MPWSREKIAQRAVRELREDMNVNCGIGVPSLMANYPLPNGVKLQNENGMSAMGPYPYEDEVDPDIISPSKHTITAAKGCAFFDAAESFAMIRGGHLDMTFIGGMQVSQKGDLANWKVPGGLIKGMGGAMDLVANTKRVIILMSHTAKDGKSKMVAECSFPLTGLECVDTVITDLGVFDIDGGFVVRELADGVTRYEVEAKTDGRLIF